jgi:hypothetical protein
MALKIRGLELKDVSELRKLHDQYYAHYEFPPFLDCLNAFIIEDETSEIVMAGSVEKTAEIMLVTNKAKSEFQIGKALVEAQRCAMFTCGIHHIRDAYAFTDNPHYARHLIKHGFIETDKALKLRVR